MAVPAFRFRFEAQRILWGDEHERTLRELSALALELEEARETADVLRGWIRSKREALAETLAGTAGGKGREVSAEDWSATCRYLDELRADLDLDVAALNVQERAVRVLEVKRTEKEREAAEWRAKLDTLERVRRRDLAAFRRRLEIKEEVSRDAEAPLHWARTQREPRSQNP
jgi:hypothetical protein